MGPSDLDNGLCFCIAVLTTTYLIEHEVAREKRSNRVALINDDCRIKIRDYSLSPFELGVQPK